MSKRLEVGSKVLCRLFNSPEGKFYGVPFEGEVTEVIDRYKFGEYSVEKGYKVRRQTGTLIVLKRKEIKRLL